MCFYKLKYNLQWISDWHTSTCQSEIIIIISQEHNDSRYGVDRMSVCNCGYGGIVPIWRTRWRIALLLSSIYELNEALTGISMIGRVLITTHAVAVPFSMMVCVCVCPHQSPWAEQDHEDDECLEPGVFYDEVAGFPQVPPIFPPTFSDGHVTALIPRHTGWNTHTQGYSNVQYFHWHNATHNKKQKPFHFFINSNIIFLKHELCLLFTTHIYCMLNIKAGHAKGWSHKNVDIW